ncbi:MAG: hypothetical protein U1D67_03940, partial [Dehalococcoidia bacterium]|nr:hypothetical protein [Dehalococcoidia bacterium]
RIVTNPRTSRNFYRRERRLDREGLTIEDELTGIEGCDRVIVGSSLDSIYGESARYAEDVARSHKIIVLGDFPREARSIKLKRIYRTTGELSACTREFANS